MKKMKRTRIILCALAAGFLGAGCDDDAQEAAYREAVLPAAVRARVAVEAASADYWRKYVGLDGAVLGMEGFGASAPGKVLAQQFGFTAERLAALAEDVLRGTAVK